MTVDKPLTIEELPFVWGKIVERLREDVSDDTYSRWFKDIELVALSDKEMTLQVPSHIYQLWIESNYMGLLRSVVLIVLGRERAVHFAFESSEVVAETPAATSEKKKSKAAVPPLVEE